MNINNKISVHLTKHGKKILDDYRTDLESKVNFKFTSTLTYDKNGKYSTELWNLMVIFGKHISMSSKQVFEDNEINIDEG